MVSHQEHGVPEKVRKSIRGSLLLASAAFIAGPGVAGAQAIISVGTASELQNAVATANNAGGNTTIMLASGTYTLSDTLYVNAPHVTIAGQPGARASTIIQGDAMSATAQVGTVIRAAGSNFELHDVTLQKSRWHLIQVVGENNADSPSIHDCVLRDAYEQMLKVSNDPAKPGIAANNGRVENCIFEYTAGIGPQYYIGGIDAHGSSNWTVRGNTFRNIASPSGSVAEFAVHFWDGSANNLVERNVIVNCDRGIGFGLDSKPNSGGIIRNNMLYHAANAAPFADVSIALTESPGSQVYNNTVYRDDGFGWAIEYRYASTAGVLIANNLLNRPVMQRDGATGTVATNVTSAVASWFVAPASGDLHLTADIPGVVHAGQSVAGLVDDFDGQSRPTAGGIDIGADQYLPAPIPNPPTGVRVL
jgi:hypothetical protein